jgi:hypothetical protein
VAFWAWNKSRITVARDLASAYRSGKTRTDETLEMAVSSALMISATRRMFVCVSVMTTALPPSLAAMVAELGKSGWILRQLSRIDETDGDDLGDDLVALRCHWAAAGADRMSRLASSRLRMVRCGRAGGGVPFLLRTWLSSSTASSLVTLVAQTSASRGPRWVE